jgi:hypothetical protein
MMLDDDAASIDKFERPESPGCREKKQPVTSSTWGCFPKIFGNCFFGNDQKPIETNRNHGIWGKRKLSIDAISVTLTWHWD